MSTREDFWSRRKARVAAEEEAEVKARLAEEQAVEQAAYEEKSDEEVLAELGLPDPDTLQEGDDFSVFMKSAVPDRIRRRALRKLWVSNPVLANVDGLLDYGEDFTDGALVVENLQTAYQVGKGMLKHVEELARQEAAKANGEPVFAPAQPDQTTESAAADTEDAQNTPEQPEDTTLVADQPEPVAVKLSDTVTESDAASDELTLPTRRRLRFDFES